MWASKKEVYSDRINRRRHKALRRVRREVLYVMHGNWKPWPISVTLELVGTVVLLLLLLFFFLLSALDRFSFHWKRDGFQTGRIKRGAKNRRRKRFSPFSSLPLSQLPIHTRALNRMVGGVFSGAGSSLQVFTLFLPFSYWEIKAKEE